MRTLGSPAWRLVLAVVTMSLLPSIASARSPIRIDPDILSGERMPYSIGAAVEGGSTGDLIIAFYNPDPIHAIEVPMRVLADTVQYDWLTVEIKNADVSRTLRFVQDRDRSAVETVRIQPRGLHFETIDLDAHTSTLPAGDYDVIVTWDGLVTTTKLTSTHVQYVCGGMVPPPLKQNSPSGKLPFVLAGLAIAPLLLALGLAKRAGTAAERVPCSPS
jgi:hypothetical protein